MLASKGRRFLNMIIDRIVFYLIFALIGVLLGLIFSLVGYEEGIIWIENLSYITPLLDYLITFLAIFAYFMILESLVSRTIGKALTKTIVVLENGEKPTPKDIAIRTISRFVPFDPFSFLGDPSRGWHDSWSNTYVVREDILQEYKILHQRFLDLGEKTTPVID
jgi:uncharacterized RDD family membrane protein YckC